MNKLYIIFLTFGLAFHANAQLDSLAALRMASVQESFNPEEEFNPNSVFIIEPLPNIVQSISNVLFGSCVDISNLQFGYHPNSIGYFRDTTGLLGIDSGLVMTTGAIQIAAMPNFAGNMGNNNNVPGHPLLNEMISNLTYDACFISFDFTPQADTIIACTFRFGSEEYPEWVWSGYNDVFAFFISGPGITPEVGQYKNLARLPNPTQTIMSIDSINQIVNNNFYFANDLGASPMAQHFQYDGFVNTVTLEHPVTPGETYSFIIVIADARDAIYDSGVFLKAGSFLGNQALPVAKFSSLQTNGYTVQFMNESLDAKVYEWDFGNGFTSSEENPEFTFDGPGIYPVKLKCANYCYFDIDTTINIMVTEPSYTIHLENDLRLISYPDGVYQIHSHKAFGNYLYHVSIHDLSGKLLFQESLSGNNLKAETYYLNKYDKGIYLLSVSNPFQRQVYKLVR
jgi:PKD repeat protein